jgi:hypothetical protein
LADEEVQGGQLHTFVQSALRRLQLELPRQAMVLQKHATEETHQVWMDNKMQKTTCRTTVPSWWSTRVKLALSGRLTPQQQLNPLSSTLTTIVPVSVQPSPKPILLSSCLSHLLSYLVQLEYRSFFGIHITSNY